MYSLNTRYTFIIAHATFPNMHSNCVKHNAGKINSFYFCCTIVEAQRNRKYEIKLFSLCLISTQSPRILHKIWRMLVFFSCVYVYIEAPNFNNTFNTFTSHPIRLTWTRIHCHFLCPSTLQHFQHCCGLYLPLHNHITMPSPPNKNKSKIILKKQTMGSPRHMFIAYSHIHCCQHNTTQYIST